MDGKANASCLCGEVEMACGTPIGKGSYCHCEDCRKQSGSAFSVAIPFDADRFRLLKGSVGSFTKIADSGDEITRNFCLNCGSPVYGTSPKAPDIVFVKAGVLHDQSLVQPTHQSWCRSKVSWADIDANAPRFAEARSSG